MSTDIAIQQSQAVVQQEPASQQTALAIRSDLEAQVALAVARPRDVSKNIAKARGLACMDKPTAVRMFYSLNRDGKPMAGLGKNPEKFGPTVRLTEIFLATYQNLRTGSRLIKITDEHVVVSGFAHDLESNSIVESEEIASILTREGHRFSEHMITRTYQGTAAKARRNALLQIIPRVFIENVMSSCIKVAEGSTKSRNDRWKDLVAEFAKHKATEKQMLMLIGKTGIADASDRDLATLESDLARIEDGEETIDSLLDSLQIEERGKSDVG